MKFQFLTTQELIYIPAPYGNRPNHRKKVWKCLCECGNIVNRTDDYLRSDDINKFIVSCGCQDKKRRTGKNNHCWSGCGDISGNFFCFAKCRAKERGIEFDITIEDMWELFCKQSGKCAITQVLLTFPTSAKTKTIATASLDRIDSKKGYVIGNIQFVHKHINIMKLTHDQDYFIKLCHMVAQANPIELNKLT